MLKRRLLQRMIVGSWTLITINTLIFWLRDLLRSLPAPGADHRQFAGYTLVLSAASLVGCALGATCPNAIGRRWSIIGASIVTIVTGYIYARFNARPTRSRIGVGSC